MSTSGSKNRYDHDVGFFNGVKFGLSLPCRYGFFRQRKIFESFVNKLFSKFRDGVSKADCIAFLM